MSKLNFHKLFINEKGAALVWVLILFVVVSILAFSVIFVARQDAIETQFYEQRLKAYYISLSGIEIGYAALMTETTAPDKYIDEFDDLSKAAVVYTDSIIDNGNTIGNVSVTISNVMVSGKRWIQIKSQGSLEGTTTSVTSSLRIDPTNHENIIRDEFGY